MGQLNNAWLRLINNMFEFLMNSMLGRAPPSDDSCIYIYSTF